MSFELLMLTAGAVASWASVALLIRRALQRPWIGALSVWTVTSILLALFGTLCVVFVYNRDAGYSLISLDDQRIAFSVLVFLLLCMNPLWLVLFATDRLGGGR